MIDKSTQGEIVAGCIKGDRIAQKRLYETFYGKMMGVSLRYATDRSEAKDILHDAFIKVYGSLDRFNNDGSLEGWVRRIVVNTAIDHLRKHKKKLLFVDTVESWEDYEHIHDDGTEENALKDIKPEVILNMIQQLPPAYRTVFNLYVMENLTHKEIGEKLGINEGTSKSNLAKARMNLKKMLTQMIIVKNE